MNVACIFFCLFPMYYLLSITQFRDQLYSAIWMNSSLIGSCASQTHSWKLKLPVKPYSVIDSGLSITSCVVVVTLCSPLRGLDRLVDWCWCYVREKAMPELGVSQLDLARLNGPTLCSKAVCSCFTPSLSLTHWLHHNSPPFTEVCTSTLHVMDLKA